MTTQREDEREVPEDVPSFRWIVAGCTGSGKTWLVKWLIRNIPEGELSELIVISATGRAKDWPETTPSRVFTDWDPQRLRRQMNRPGHKLFVIDDFLGLIRPDEPALVHLFTAGRHHGSSVMLITQRLNGFAPAIRVNAGRIYLCRTIAAKELDLLYDETASSRLRKRTDWYAFVEKSTRSRGVLVIELIDNGKDQDPYSVVKPPGKLDDHFVEPGYDTDPEDAIVSSSGDKGARRAYHAKYRRVPKKPLPASNRKWHFRNAERRERKGRAPRRVRPRVVRPPKGAKPPKRG